MPVVLCFGDSLTYGFGPAPGGRFPPDSRWPDDGPPACLVVAPPPIVEPKGPMGVFFEGREAESRALEGHYRTICQQTGTAFFAAGDVVRPSPVDGIHLDPDGQRALGAALAQRVGEML